MGIAHIQPSLAFGGHKSKADGLWAVIKAVIIDYYYSLDGTPRFLSAGSIYLYVARTYNGGLSRKLLENLYVCPVKVSE